MVNDQDMALYDMTKNIVAGNPVRAFNWGLMKRDFTYISDIISLNYVSLIKIYLQMKFLIFIEADKST